MPLNLCDHTALEIAELIRRRDASAVEVFESVAHRVEQVEGRSGMLDYQPSDQDEAQDRKSVHAFVAPLPLEAAHRQAELVDEAIARGDDPGILAGVPVAVKDIFCTKDTRTTAASKILHNYEAPYDATAVKRLRAAGCVLIGKTNLDEFVYGSSSESSAFKPVPRNPWNPSRVPGGSSGGSAAAVAAGQAAIALGSDTAGSIRQPAAFCGAVGMKPTYGLVSRWGLIAMAASIDCVGPLTRNVKDCALALRVIAGHDTYDWTTATNPIPDYVALLDDDAVKKTIRGLKIGWPKEYFEDEDLIDPVEGAAIVSAIDAAADVFRSLGAEIVPISLPHTSYAIPTYFVVSRVELASDLHRFDGVRYGHRTSEPVDNLFEMYEASRTEGFGVQPKQRIMMGMHVSSAGYSDQLYDRALRLRALIRHDFDQAFENVDLIMSATTPTTAFPLGGIYGDTVQMQNADRLTVPANHAGIPAISQPCGFDGQGLPIGLQLIGPDFSEVRILQAAHAYESETDWHTNRPSMIQSDAKQ